MNKKLESLQLLRGVAAVAVVVHHAITYLDNDIYRADITNKFHLGSRGVELFFVLSGFIIYHIHHADPSGFNSFKVFSYKRFFRIFPMTFLVATGWALVAGLSYSMGLSKWPTSFETWFSSAFILPAVVRPDPLVIWTLRHEVFFYAIFSIFFFSKRGFALAMVAWMMASLVVGRENSIEAVGWEVPLSLVGAKVNILFAIGLLVGILQSKWKGKQDLSIYFFFSLILVGLATYLFGRADGADWQFEKLIFGIVSAFAIFTAAFTFKRFPVFDLLGDASFSIYLVHIPTVVIAKAFVVPLVGNYLGCLLVLTVVGTVAGVLVHLIVERPILDASRRFIRSRRRRLVASDT